ncbi:methyltransferase domain-containing protein [Candidatus Falkowbacteria bacterium]|nr:methyltransferase domain-containing protein [Candidatus Falkowbacteria bacterium]
MRYFFVLGKTPELSVLEFFEMSKAHDSCGSRVLDKVLVVSKKEKIDVRGLMEGLGGTVKAGEIIKEAENLGKIDLGELADFILDNVDKTKKVYFGFSILGKRQEKKKKMIMSLGLGVKKLLRNKGVKARFVTSKDEDLSSVVVKKNKLVSGQGAELVIIERGDERGILIGRTLEVQDFSGYSKRDYGRPNRDMKVGMIPLKLARMMINITGAGKEEEVLDPFCGEGTILQELAILGYKKIIGGDKDGEMVRQAKVNLDWLGVECKMENEEWSQRCSLYRGDVIKLSEVIPNNSLGAIVTEPHLGPPLKGGEGEEEIENIRRELSELYLGAFKEFKKVLKKGGVVVMVFPFFIQGERVRFLDITKEIEKIGFESVLGKRAGDLADLTERGSILYFRPGQRTGREVFKFRVDK